MKSDPENPPLGDQPLTGSIPPLLPPPAATPPPLLSPPGAKSSQPALAILLSLCLGIFLADGIVSLIDDSLIFFLNVHVLAVVRGIVFFFAALFAVVTYVLMAFTPRIPKRLFLPVALFNPAAELAAIPLVIFFYHRLPQIVLAVSIGQVIVGLYVLHRVQGGFNLRWPLVPASQLADGRFSWRSLLTFVAVNLFVLVPAAAIYLVLCAGLAVSHFSDGFIELRREGLVVRVREYLRNDGKMIRLIPMAHVGDSSFYQTISQSFPTNSTILMEGVTDNGNLLTNKITYKRLAKTLGLAEQQKEFTPVRGNMVRADVDVGQFTTNTIQFINLVMLIHRRGVDLETMMKLTQYSPSPNLGDEVLNDLLTKRNRHLLDEIDAWLPESQSLMVPWGAAHIPEIAREIQKSGFRPVETREYLVIRFRSSGDKGKEVERDKNGEKLE